MRATRSISPGREAEYKIAPPPVCQDREKDLEKISNLSAGKSPSSRNQEREFAGEAMLNAELSFEAEKKKEISSSREKRRQDRLLRRQRDGSSGKQGSLDEVTKSR